MATAWADPAAYLQQNYTVAALNPSVQQQVQAAGPLPGFHKLVIHGTGVRVSSSVAKETVGFSFPFTTTFYPVGGKGFFNEDYQSYTNDLPSYMAVRTSFANIMETRVQEAWPGRWIGTGTPFGISNVRKWSPLTNMTEDTEFDFAYDFGAENSAVATASYAHCHSDHFYPATQVSANLTGRAIDLTCTFGSVTDSSRLSISYLEDYGLGVRRSMTTIQRKWEYHLDRIEVLD